MRAETKSTGAGRVSKVVNNGASRTQSERTGLSVWRPTSVALKLAAVSAVVLSAAVAPAYANPKGAEIVGGSATINQTSPTRLDIVQSTDRAAIDWQSFNIAPSEQTNFRQPAASSVTLNRVQAGNPSEIAGRLTANGGIVLVNPSGITFSKGAQVDVNSIVATPTDISNANFMAGRMKFDKPSSDPRATVVNNGTITVAQRGLAALVAPSVQNSGVVQAKLGKVVLAGAETYTVDFYGDGLISFDVGPKVKTVPLGADGQPLKSLVSNPGRIDAPGGTVLLTADAVGGIIQNVVDVPGQIIARTNGKTPGSVTVDAGAGGAAKVSGRIDVSGLKPGQPGGSATVTGGSVDLASTARIAARGKAGGGSVRIGGGAHGQDSTVRNAQTTNVAAGAVVDASATGSGNGGQVAVWSDQATQFAGTIKAQGGPFGGDGGWVETSGSSLAVPSTAVVSAGAPKGKSGLWLLDPALVTITNSDNSIAGNRDGNTTTFTPIPATTSSATVSASTIHTALDGNPVPDGSSTPADVVITTKSSGSGTGNITVATGVSWTSTQSLTLQADDSIAIEAPISGPAGTLVLMAGGTVSQKTTGPTPNDIGGPITVGTLRALTQNDTGAAISLTNARNSVPGDVTLSALNTAGTAPAPGAINFVNSTGFNVAAQPGNGLNGQEIGINTTAGVTLQAGVNGLAEQGGAIAAHNLVARTQFDTPPNSPGAPIKLGNFANAVSGNVTLSTLNAAGTAPAPGAIQFSDSRGFTIAAQPGNGLNGQEIGINTGVGAGVVLTAGGPLLESGAISAENFVAQTQLDSGAAIALTNVGNAVSGNVTLSALNTAGTAPAPGAITFMNSEGFTIAPTPIVLGIGINTGGNVTLQAGGRLSETGAIAAGTVTGSSTGGTVLTTAPTAPGNHITNLGSFTDTSNFGIRLTNAGPLTVTGPVTASAGPIMLTTTGAGAGLTLGGNLNGAFVELTSGGAVTQPSGAITTDVLEVASVGPVSLAGPNAVGTLRAAVSGPGNGFLFRNDQRDLTIQSVPADGNSFAGVTTNGGALEVVTTATATAHANFSIVAGTSGNGPIRTTVSSGGGAITLMAGGRGATFSNGGTINSTAAGSAAPPPFDRAGNIVILADAMALSSGTISARLGGTTASVVLGPVTPTNPTTLGTPAPVGSLNLLQADLDTISAGMLQVGYRNSNGTPSLTGNISVVSPIRISTSQIPSLLLVTGGSVNQSSGAMITALTPSSPPSIPILSLGAVAGGTVSLGNANRVDTLAGLVDGAGNSFLYRNDSLPLLVGRMLHSTIGVDFDATGVPSAAPITSGPLASPIAGVTTAGGALTVTTSGTTGVNLEIDNTISSHGGSITLMAGGIGGAFSNFATAIDSTSASAFAAGNIVILGDAISLTSGEGTPTINAGRSGTVVLGPVTAARPIALGTGSSGTLSLFQIDLDTVTAGMLQIGYRNENGTPFVTGNINIGTPITVNSDQVPSLLLVTGGGVSQAAGATITKLTSTSPPSSLSLGVIAGGPVALNEANHVDTVAGFVDVGTNSFLFRNDSTALTIGSVAGSTLGVAFDATSGIPSAAVMTGSATNPLSGVTTANGNILLETTASGSLALTEPVIAGTGSVGLASAGTLTQDPAPIVAASLAISSAERVSLGAFGGTSDLNQVRTLAAQVRNAGESFVFRNDAANLTIGTVDVTDSSGVHLRALPGPLSGVMTNNANIALRVTSSGDLQLTRNVIAGTAGVGLESAGAILQTGGAVTGSTLEVSAVGSVSLPRSNAVSVLAGQVTDLPMPNSFVYRNDGRSLTVGTVPTLLESGAETPPNNQMLSVAGLSGVTTVNGAITLQTTTSGNLVLNQSVNAGTGLVTLTSVGTITEPAGGLIAAATLTGSSVGGATLNQTNLVTNLGAFTNTGAGGFTLTDGQTLNVTGAVGAGTGGLALTTTSGNLVVGAGLSAGPTMTLTSAGTITEPAGGLIAAATLTGSSVGGATLNQTNLVTNLGSFTNTGAGGFALTDGQTLNVTGPVGAGTGGLALTTTSGNLVVGAGLSAGTTVTLTSAGTITEPAGGLIAAATLTGSSAGNASFDQGNLLANLGPFATTANGVFALTDNQALTVSGPLNTAGDLRIRVNSGDLSLVGTVTVGGGNSNAAFVATAGNITEVDDPVVTASGLIVGAAGNVSLGIAGGAVFPASANAVGTLAGTAGGSFGFLNGPALTVGTVPPVVDVPSQSGIAASATAIGDVLIQTNNAGQPLTLAGNITAGGRVIFDTAGGFLQIGAATVTAPVLAIDTTGRGANDLLGFITSPSVSANKILNLPPAGKTSNPMQFAALGAPNSTVLLFADRGAVSGSIEAGQLGLSGTGDFANLRGSIGGLAGPAAARIGVRDPGPEITYLFNDCIIASASCVVPPPGPFVVPQQPVGELTALIPLPDLAATPDFVTPDAFRAREQQNPDAPVINIFDEEHLCDETGKSSQPCQER
jgi:filamentous hemagglutinin family protein